jgi:hypothetical protein
MIMDFQWVLVPLLGDLVRYQAMFFPFPPTCEVSNIHARRKSTRIMLLPAKLQEARDMVLQGGPLPLAVFVVLTTIDNCCSNCQADYIQDISLLWI